LNCSVRNEELKIIHPHNRRLCMVEKELECGHDGHPRFPLSNVTGCDKGISVMRWLTSDRGPLPHRVPQWSRPSIYVFVVLDRHDRMTSWQRCREGKFRCLPSSSHFVPCEICAPTASLLHDDNFTPGCSIHCFDKKIVSITGYSVWTR
jgi:hypothetical protein